MHTEHSYIRILFLSILGVLAFWTSEAQFYNGSQQEFGKNRVQYKNFDWLYYPSSEVDVYFYNGGKDLAVFTVQSAETSLIEVQQLFDYTLEERIQIIVYNTQTDFRQSNIGIIDDDQGNIGGATEIVGSKLFVYFDGDHGNFAKQIKEGIAQVLFNQMMLGGNWKDVLRSSTFLTIPEWYRKGIMSYAGEEWSSEADKYIRDGIETGLYSSFNDLKGEQIKYCGHALWKYIADVYGENVIPNILYMTKISRNIEDGFLFVLGQDLSTISNEFVKYWEAKFSQDKNKYPELKINRLYTEKQLETQANWELTDAVKKEETEAKFAQLINEKDSKSYKKLKLLTENWDVLGYAGKKWRKLDKRFEKYMGAIPVKYKSKYTYSQFKRSPDGEYVSFVTHELGQYKVWLYEISSGKLKRLVKRDHKIERNQDKSYPKTTWHPNGDMLTFITEKRGRVFLNNYQLSNKKTIEKELFRIDKVIDLSYSDDGKKIVFSGVALGQTDLYMYYVIGNNQTRLTNDVYDDLNPSFLPNSESIIFSSNRPDDTLREDVPISIYPNIKDIYVFHPGNNPSLDQITRTPEIDEEQPEALSDKYFSYLSYQNKFKNQYAAYVDSAISRIDTVIHYSYFTRETALSNFSYQLDDYEINSEANTYGYSVLKGGRPQYNWGYINQSGDVSATKEEMEQFSTVTKNTNAETFTSVPIEEKNIEVNHEDYVFNDDSRSTEIEKEIVRIQDISEESDSTALAKDEFKLPKSRNYRLNFVIDEVTTQLDNSLGFEMYQSYGLNRESSSNPTSNLNQGNGLGGMAKVSDLFEDHKLKGVLRLNITNPRRTSLEGGVFYQDLRKRLDKKYSIQRFARETEILETFTVLRSQRILTTYELVYPLDEIRSVRGKIMGYLDELRTAATDVNTVGVPTQRDLTAGVRLSYVYDNTRVLGLNALEGTRYKLFAEYYRDTEDKNSDFKTVGLDFRHYKNIYRNLIVATRAAGTASFGSRTLLNILGGVDNEQFARQTNNIPSTQENYYYFTQAAPMRGFFQNSRTGNNFGVINNEIRWPLFQFFSKKPLNSEFTKSFQFTLFSDIGAAWDGLNPYESENRFNSVEYITNNLTVRVNNNREPIIWSYGFGARAKVLGYFIRADYGWGIDDGERLDGILHLSLNLDF